MPRFTFEATDSSGRPTEGTLDAATQDDAVRVLASQGLRLRSLGFVPAGALTRSVPPLATRQDAPERILPSRRVSRAQSSFLFSQAARLLKAGIAPAAAFSQMSALSVPPHLKSVLSSVAGTAAEGGSVGAAMTRFPETFAPSACAAVRAGEAGGYLPEAFATLADEAERAHKVAWHVRLFRWQMLLALVGLPLVLAWSIGSEAMMARMFSLPGADLSPGANLATLFSKFGKGLAGPIGVVLGVFVVAYVFGAVWGKRAAQRRLRHWLVLKVPFAANHAKNEAFTIFSWHLSKLAVAGLSPMTAWQLAAPTATNQVLADRLVAAGATSRETDTMSELASRSGALPEETVQLIQLGEFSGTIPDALDQASKLSRGSMDTSERILKLGWMALCIAVTALCVTIAAARFYSGWYGTMIDYTVGDKADVVTSEE